MNPGRQLLNLMRPVCPVGCGNHIGQGKIFVCEQCWWKVPTNDRVRYRAIRTNSGERAAQFLGDKIIAELKKNLPARIGVSPTEPLGKL